MSNILQAGISNGSELILIQIDFSSAFDQVSHFGFLYKLRSVGIAGSLFSVVEQGLSNREHRVVVDGGKCAPTDALSGVPHGSVLGLPLFITNTDDIFWILESQIVGKVNDSILLEIVEYLRNREAISASHRRDLFFELMNRERFGAEEFMLARPR